MPQAPATLVFYPEFAREDAVRALEGFSHIWLLFVFHGIPDALNPDSGGMPGRWSPIVRPPRLGGNRKVGVFASRSPFRPNPIGMSAVRLKEIEKTPKGPILHLSGADILDQTPVLDIKPYLTYADAVSDARDGFASGPPDRRLEVIFTDRAMKQIKEKETAWPMLLPVIQGVLEQDPRPAYRAGRQSPDESGRIFGTRLFDFDLKWTVRGRQVTVLDISPAEPA